MKEKLKNFIAKKREKEQLKKPKYGTRKLKIGLVSCLLGFIMFSTPALTLAKEVESNNNLVNNVSVENNYVNKNITLRINGVVINNTEEYASFIKDNRTFVPLRLISEQLGFKVDWNEETKDITITNGDKKIIFNVVKDTYLNKNGVLVQMDVKPIIKNNRTFLPIRFVSEALGIYINWDNNTRTVDIVKYETKEEDKTSRERSVWIYSSTSSRSDRDRDEDKEPVRPEEPETPKEPDTPIVPEEPETPKEPDTPEKSEEKIKKEFSEAVDKSLKEIASKAGEGVTLNFDKGKKVATIKITDIDKVKIQNTGAITAVKKLVEENGLVSYKINEEKELTGKTEKQIQEAILEDFGKQIEGLVDKDGKLNLEKLNGKEVKATVKIKDNENRIVEDNYKVKFINDIVNKKIEALKNTAEINYDNLMSDTAKAVTGQGVMDVNYDKDSNKITVTIKENAKKKSNFSLGGTGFKTLMAQIISGSKINDKEYESKNLKNLKLKIGEKEIVINKEDLAKANKPSFFALSSFEPFIKSLIPEGKNIFTFSLGDLIGKEANLTYTYGSEFGDYQIESAVIFTGEN